MLRPRFAKESLFYVFSPEKEKMESIVRFGLGGYGRGRPVEIGLGHGVGGNCSSYAAPRVHGTGGIGRGMHLLPVGNGGVVGAALEPAPVDDDDFEEELPVARYSDFDGVPRVRKEAMKLEKVFASVKELPGHIPFFPSIGFPVRVSYLEDPNYFCLQSQGQRNWLRKREKLIHESIVDAGDALNMDLELSYKDHPCAVLVSDMWRRGFIMRTNSNTSPQSIADYWADVMVVDHGNRGMVPMSQLKLLPQDWLKVPPMAYRVMLDGAFQDVTLENMKEARGYRRARLEHFLSKFNEMVHEPFMECKFVDLKDPVEVTLIGFDHRCDLCGKKTCTVNDRLERLVSGRRC